MKKRNLMLCTCCIAIFLIQFTSCVKPPKDFDPRDAKNVFDGCRVKRITLINPAQTINFVYNSKGDPVTVTPSDIGTGNTKKSFYYDKKGKLVRMVEFYSDDDGYENAHYYAYENNRITRDTLYSFGRFSTGSYYGAGVYYIYYDNYNRVSSDSFVAFPPFQITQVRNFAYNAAGNLASLVLPDPYDNKLNIHRTNKIWMFIDRDYSVNNPIKATAYSYYGLPLSYAQPEGYLRFARFYISNSTIEYDCK